MRLYVEVAKRAFQRQLAYRTATLAGLTTNAFFGALRSFLFIGLYNGRGIEAGWSVQDAVDYVWLAQSLIMPLSLWGLGEIGATIRSGDVIADLTKPFDYYTFWLSQEAGRALYQIVFRMAPTLVIGALLFGLRLPPEPGRWLVFAASLVLAIWISFGIRFTMSVSAFWLMDYRGVGAMVLFGSYFFSGFLVPLVYFPDWARQALQWLPFAGIVQTPIDVILGKAVGADLIAALGGQLAWAVALMGAGRWLVALGERKVVVQGG